MDAWSWVWGAFFGLALFVVAGWIFVKFLDWVLPTTARRHPRREEDEDEIDHRFY
jgi:hypothetical protein